MRSCIYILSGILLFTIVGCAQESNSEAEKSALRQHNRGWKL